MDSQVPGKVFLRMDALVNDVSIAIGETNS